MTIEEAEALYWLAQHSYEHAEHGQKTIMRKWRDDAAIRKLSMEVVTLKAALYDQIAKRAP